MVSRPSKAGAIGTCANKTIFQLHVGWRVLDVWVQDVRTGVPDWHPNVSVTCCVMTDSQAAFIDLVLHHCQSVKLSSGRARNVT